MKKLIISSIFVLTLFSLTLATNCVDSDGMDYFNYGQVTELSEYNKTLSYLDKCVVLSNRTGGYAYEDGIHYADVYECEAGECWIAEAYCSNDEQFFDVEVCEQGCYYGKCLVEPMVTCTDSDGGLNFGVKGETEGLLDGVSSTRRDHCGGINSEYLTEFFCEDGEIKAIMNYSCQNGCFDGACINEQGMDTCLDNSTNWWDQETDSCNEGFTEELARILCSDPDGGRNQHVQAHTFGFRSSYANDRDKRIRTGGKDACGSGTQMTEHYCDSMGYMQVVYDTCLGNCSDGVCYYENDSEVDEEIILLENGGFSLGFDSWEKYHASNVNDNYNILIISDSGKRDFLDFKRKNSRNDGGKTWARQEIEMDTAGYESLHLSANVRVISSTLSGDWWPTGEGNYPVHVHIRYLDEEGNTHWWSHGFVEHEMRETAGRTNYEIVTANRWISYTSIDLLLLNPKPVKIIEVAVGGDGWDYHGQIDDIIIMQKPKISETPIEGRKVVSERLVEAERYVNGSSYSDFETAKEKIVENEVLTEEYEQKVEQRGFVYQLQWFFGMTEKQEQEDVAFLKNQHYALSYSAEILMEIAEQTEDPAKSILIEQANELLGKAGNLMQEAEIKEKNSKGLLSWLE